jgi:hypothetical protein
MDYQRLVKNAAKASQQRRATVTTARKSASPSQGNVVKKALDRAN